MLFAGAHDIGLSDTETVDPLADDVDRLVELARS